jgi:hypothetical protein
LTPATWNKFLTSKQHIGSVNIRYKFAFKMMHSFFALAMRSFSSWIALRATIKNSITCVELYPVTRCNKLSMRTKP